jgi:hypothetical protein
VVDLETHGRAVTSGRKTGQNREIKDDKNQYKQL